ncbi:IcmF-like protein [Psychromonas sp. CNPT3]|uniref:type VI secretion system membrane subunit TssM n=1 Tax=Psychromonas sp. CNPT3 TaxID=314282 RepID=UPI00006E85F4|nr:type VI secretion system membrane subunit TssM [Psychromonas sp. CNPT3]AGH81618.1 IcmF-like protein [Psychromonas sp. CNPT3]
MWNKLKTILMKVVPGLRAAMPILLVIIFILLNIAIWWAGPKLVISGDNPLQSVLARSITTIIFLLFCMTAWGILQWRRLQRYHEEKDLEALHKNDPIKHYEERQEIELNQVMLAMKESMNKRNYLYALPWYLVLGLENAGKTSLINRSGQNFVFSSVLRASGNKSENPYSFDWWISDDAVLIDPDGELLTQGNMDDSEEGEVERRLWLHFIQWLEKIRSRRPLNGVVLALDIENLSTARTTERLAYSSLLRARLRELMEKLSTRLPVYITLTKLDLLYGFEPFFRQYTRAQREQILGFTFTMDSVKDQDSWLGEFDENYSSFITRINDCLPRSLLSSIDAEERRAIYSFSRQMAGMHDVLKQFLHEVLGSDQFSTSALVRGVYFLSVYQQGVPSNAFVDAASRRYSLPSSINSAQDAKNSTPYFTQKLFSEVIYAEAGLASDNFRAAKHKRRLLMLSVVACSIASLLLIGSWHEYYKKNIAQANAVLVQVNNYKKEYALDLLTTDSRDILVPLNTIRKATLEFGFFRDKSRFISDMGLYQGHIIGPKVEETYLNLLRNSYLPILMQQVMKNLSIAQSDDNKLTLLRVYRMLTDKSGRNDKLVEDYFMHVWQKSYPRQRQTQEMLLLHLDYAMQHTDLQGARQQGDKDALYVLQPYDSLVAKNQRALSVLPIAERVYRNLKKEAISVLGAPLDLRNNIGPVFNLVFEQRMENHAHYLIPDFLTKDGFDRYFMPKSDLVSELALLDNWVLGKSKSAEFSEADKKVLRDKIRAQYVADYTDTWRVAINNINVKYFADINGAVLVLDNITGNKQPFMRLLQTLKTNTRLFPTLPENAKERLELMKLPKYKVATMIDSKFSQLNALLETQDTQPVYMDEVINAVDQLLSYLKSIQNAPDMGKAALAATQARVDLSNADPIYVLQRIASGLPKPLDSMIKKLADESWYVVKQEAIKYLEVRWIDDVYKEYQEKLASRYPFDAQSKKDVSLQDFEQFFAPNGTLNEFYNKQLKIFMDESLAKSESNSGHSLIRQEVLDQLQQAKKIQQAFFNRKGILNVEFSLEPIELSANKRRSVINVDGQYVEYSHGPRKSVELLWPNTLRASATSKVTLVPSAPNRSPRSIKIQGPWAFFRLLDKGQVISASATSVDYKFKIDGGYARYRLHSEADNNPFTTSLFKSFKLSNTLY